MVRAQRGGGREGGLREGRRERTLREAGWEGEEEEEEEYSG